MTQPPFPLLPGKHALPAVTDPAEHAAYVRTRHPGATLADTAGTVLIYQRALLEHARTQPHTRSTTGWVRGDLLIHEPPGHHPVAICGGFGVGGPAAALAVEQLTALGTPRIITVGTAASLHGSLLPGELIVCDRALRGDGTSHHYLPPAPYAHPCPHLTRHFAQTLHTANTRFRHAATWTTDAPYRETAQEVDCYAGHGVMLCDMEAAAVFATSRYRNIPAAAAFTTADSLANRQPRRHDPAVAAALIQLYGAALTTLRDTLGTRLAR
ncbi:nucleoside phosphorylase [Streptomyces sp. NEAU-S7GS2]|uniref:nucleoside phosphorylase n=1 Tax=Streptomyces sp. NEAU-S7GS2 TaxID=2202000 RepID=UPI000D6FADDE|nr:nucleoside phosphorylase [Streptomyces sp. NEAU-S7GS2]AWN24825.1 phosphorylase [Streptomyces sp. NEAU-S7GS2]